MSKISGAMVAEKRHTCRAGQPQNITTTYNNNQCCCQLIAFRSTLAHFHRAPVNYTHLTGILLQSICNPYYKLQGGLLGEPARQEAGTWRCRRSGPCANSKHRRLKASGLMFPLLPPIISWYRTLRSFCIQIMQKIFCTTLHFDCCAGNMVLECSVLKRPIVNAHSHTQCLSASI